MERNYDSASPYSYFRIVREAPGFDPFKVQSDADVVRSAYTPPLRFAPGEKWEYCNTGYFALAEIIRKVAGRPWTEYLNEKVFVPAGMKTTYPTNTKARVLNLAQGYVDNTNCWMLKIGRRCAQAARSCPQRLTW